MSWSLAVVLPWSASRRSSSRLPSSVASSMSWSTASLSPLSARSRRTDRSDSSMTRNLSLVFPKPVGPGVFVCPVSSSLFRSTGRSTVVGAVFSGIRDLCCAPLSGRTISSGQAVRPGCRQDIRGSCHLVRVWAAHLLWAESRVEQHGYAPVLRTSFRYFEGEHHDCQTSCRTQDVFRRQQSAGRDASAPHDHRSERYDACDSAPRQD